MAQRIIAAINPQLTVKYQSYAEAYDQDFEDIRRRVPDLSRLRGTINYQPQYDLTSIIQDMIRSRTQPND